MLVRCASIGPEDPDGFSNSTGGGTPREETSIVLGSGGSKASIDEGPAIHPLCGVGSCVPDDVDACSSSGGAGGASSSLAGPGGAGGAAGLGEDLACSVELEEEPCEGESCTVQRNCVVAGDADVDDPCLSSADCVAGLACVGDGVSGVCRPYCCATTESTCQTDESFCDVRPLVETPEVYVPVCVPADNCSLWEQACSGEECECAVGRSCMVVRNDGTTSCVAPGTGKEGDSCRGVGMGDCAAGYVCSAAAGCLRVCSTLEEESGCDDGELCLSPAEFPDELGVCAQAVGLP